MLKNIKYKSMVESPKPKLIEEEEREREREEQKSLHPPYPSPLCQYLLSRLL